MTIPRSRIGNRISRWFVSHPHMHSHLRGDIQRVARALHPVLLSNFLDSAPAVFSPSSAPLQTELGIVSAVANIYRNLYGTLLQNSKVRIGGLSKCPFLTKYSSSVLVQVFFWRACKLFWSEWHPIFPFFPVLLLDATFKQVPLAFLYFVH